MTKRKSSTLGVLVESYINQRLIRQRQASLATLASYKDALRLLFHFTAARLGKRVDCLDIQDLDYETILAFLDSLERDRGNSIRTRNARLAVIHSFFQHVAYSAPEALALAQRILSIGSKRMTKSVVGYLQPPEVEALLAAPCRNDVRGRRDYALLLCLLRTGVRASEAIGINASDLQLNSPSQMLVHGKGSKDRALPLSDDLTPVLRALLEERKISAHEQAAVFVNTKNERLTRFGLTHVVRRAVEKASTKCPNLTRRSVSPHSFRHTCAMNMLQDGLDISVIRAWLGHVSIQTTHEYLEADLEMKRQALKNANITSTPVTRYDPPSAILALLER